MDTKDWEVRCCCVLSLLLCLFGCVSRSPVAFYTCCTSSMIALLLLLHVPEGACLPLEIVSLGGVRFFQIECVREKPGSFALADSNQHHPVLPRRRQRSAYHVPPSAQRRTNRAWPIHIHYKDYYAYVQCLSVSHRSPTHTYTCIMHTHILTSCVWTLRSILCSFFRGAGGRGGGSRQQRNVR